MEGNRLLLLLSLREEELLLASRSSSGNGRFILLLLELSLEVLLPLLLLLLVVLTVLLLAGVLLLYTSLAISCNALSTDGAVKAAMEHLFCCFCFDGFIALLPLYVSAIKPNTVDDGGAA